MVCEGNGGHATEPCRLGLVGEVGMEMVQMRGIWTRGEWDGWIGGMRGRLRIGREMLVVGCDWWR